MRKIVGMVLLACIIFMLVPSERAAACSCIVPEDAIAGKEQASAVVQGTVLKIKKSFPIGEAHNAVLLDVQRSWKGNESSQMIVYTDWSSCMFEFEQGVQYLLYTYEHKGVQKVFNCGRSTEIAQADQDLAQLGAGQPPTIEVNLEWRFIEPIWILAMVILLLLISALLWLVMRRRRADKRNR
ncbi:hypothetical protein [Paenibacillus marinisediminis]